MGRAPIVAEGTRTVDIHVRRFRERLRGLAPYLRVVKARHERLVAGGAP